MSTELEKKVTEKVRSLIDPETGMTLGEMNLIKGVKEVEKGVVQVDFSLTSPFCPIALPLALQIKKVAESVEGVSKSFVYLHDHVKAQAINQIVNK